MDIAKNFLRKKCGEYTYLLPYGQAVVEQGRSVKLDAHATHLLDVLLEAKNVEEATQSLLSQGEMEADFRHLIATLEQAGALSVDEEPQLSVREETMRFSIGGRRISFVGAPRYVARELLDFCVETSEDAPDGRFVLCGGNPPHHGMGEVLVHHEDLLILREDAWLYYLYPNHRYLREMVMDVDGQVANAYLPFLDEDTPAVTAEIFLAMRQAFFYGAALANRYAIHSASVLYEGKAYLFSGPSGMGKSTQANLWKQCFGTEIFNGDVNLVSIEADGAYVWGLPWNGTSGIYRDGRVPLGGIIYLRQSLENQVEVPDAGDLVVATVQRLISPTYTEGLYQKAFSFAEQLQGKIPMWRLYCNPTPQAAEIMKECIDEYR